MDEAKKNKNKFFVQAYRFFANIIYLLFFLTLLQVFAFRFIDSTFVMSNLSLRLKNIFTSERYIIPKGEWRSLNDISPYLIKAVLAAEDQRFMYHSGFDFREIYRAVKDSYSDKKIRGASTITMQMARTVFLWHGRDILRKTVEAYYTVLIEFVMPKKRIMEIYLNTVDWGIGIRGAEAASKKYFHKKSSALTAEEAALLAAILRGPHTLSPINPDEYVIARQTRILKDMAKMNL